MTQDSGMSVKRASKGLIVEIKVTYCLDHLFGPLLIAPNSFAVDHVESKKSRPALWSADHVSL